MSLVNFILALNSNTQTSVDPEEPPTSTVLVSAYKSVSNKYVDITFNRGIYATNPILSVSSFAAVVSSSNFSIIDFVTAGGVSNIAIASVKINNHYTSGSASDLIGGDLVVRVFLTLTGTPNSTESFRIRCTDIYNASGAVDTLTTPTIKLNITPVMLWDMTETAAVTTLSLGISQLTDVMGLDNFTQSTDAQRPLDGGNLAAFNLATPKHMTAGATQAAFQKGNSFTIAIKRFKSSTTGVTSYIFSRRGGNANNQGWSISVAADNSLFFVLRTTAAQGFVDYDGFTPNSEINLFFINNNGTLNIRNAAGTALGTTGDATAIGTITYTSIDMLLGRRMTETTNSYWTGWFEKIAIFNSALTNDQIADVNENFDNL